MSIVAVRNIMPGEEILVNYNYDVKMAPDWYQTLWKQYMQNNDHSKKIDLEAHSRYLHQNAKNIHHAKAVCFPNQNSDQNCLRVSLVAVRNIMPGGEILVNYNYNVKMAPHWYQSLWKHYIQNNDSSKKIDLEAHSRYLHQNAKNIHHGKAVCFPDPDQNSDWNCLRILQSSN